MIVVSDSTPLITLMKAMRLDVLCDLFGEVCIPEAVFAELTTNEKYPGEAIMIRESNFIKVVAVNKSESVSLLQRATGLDRGESEAIVYADDHHADFLLMDEVAGRTVAQKMNIPIMGSIGVLVNAYRRGLMSAANVETAFEKIRAANRQISEKLIQNALSIVHEDSQ